MIEEQIGRQIHVETWIWVSEWRRFKFELCCLFISMDFRQGRRERIHLIHSVTSVWASHVTSLTPPKIGHQDCVK